MNLSYGAILADYSKLPTSLYFLIYARILLQFLIENVNNNYTPSKNSNMNSNMYTLSLLYLCMPLNIMYASSPLGVFLHKNLQAAQAENLSLIKSLRRKMKAYANS